MRSANSHDITDLLDEVLDSDDSDGMIGGCGPFSTNKMEIDVQAKEKAKNEVFSLFNKRSSSSSNLKKSKSLEHIPENVVSVLSAAARASNTSLENLGYDTGEEKENMEDDDDKMEDESPNDKMLDE